MRRKLAFMLAVLAIMIGSASEARAAVAPAPVSGVAHAPRPAAMLGRGGIGAIGTAASQRRMAYHRGLRKEGDQRSPPDRVTPATVSGTMIQPTQPRRHDAPAIPVTAYVTSRDSNTVTPSRRPPTRRHPDHDLQRPQSRLLPRCHRDRPGRQDRLRRLLGFGDGDPDRDRHQHRRHPDHGRQWPRGVPGSVSVLAWPTAYVLQFWEIRWPTRRMAGHALA
jgi:hypothetical protein